jgi:hypothetical protein
MLSVATHAIECLVCQAKQKPDHSRKNREK